jgi:hypothetical protein
MAVSGKGHSMAALSLTRCPGTYCTGGWAGSRADLDVYEEEKMSCSAPGFETRMDEPVPGRQTDCAVTDQEMNESSYLQYITTYKYKVVQI